MCGKNLREMGGLFCGNFAICRPPWKECRAAWCGSCYIPHELDKFFQYTLADEDGFEWGPKPSQLHYKMVRDGDHLVTPFQFDLCHFCNLTHHNPELSSPQDSFLLCCICHTNLDARWGGEPLTVQATLSWA